MAMNEIEWTALSEAWTSSHSGVDAAPLRKIVDAHRRRLLIEVAGESVLLAAFVWVTYIVLRTGVTPWKVVWAVTLWTFAAIAVAFVWRNRSGTWDAMGDSVAEFVRLTRQRAERQRRSLRFGVALFIAEVVVAVAQLAWFDRLTLLAVLLLAGSGGIALLWYAAVRRRIARDLEIAAEYDTEADYRG